jgi:hypothetical protein
MFRTIVPLFHFTTNGETFSCTGDYLGSRYEISVYEYQLDGNLPNTTIPQENFNELMVFASENAKQELRNIHTIGGNTLRPAKCFLVIDTDSSKSYQIRELCLNALRLHATKGAIYYGDYTSNSASKVNQNYVRVQPRRPDVYPPLHKIPFQPSEFLATEFDSCRQTLKVLLSENWMKDTQHKRVLKLAISYYWGSLRVDQREFAYMMLAIAFEAMFKANGESAEAAVKRLSRILAKTRRECKAISRSLSQGSSSYSKIRNAIAHGDEAYNYESISDAYEMFYPYIRKSIIALLQIDESTITESSDYYANLSLYLEDKYNKLPS